MKKKLLSMTAVVLAMAMTSTSVFAAIERGDGDANNDGAVTATDVESLYTGKAAADNQKGNVNGDYSGSVDNKATASDAQVLIYQLLQPKYVEESYAVRAYTSTPILQSPIQYSGGLFNGTSTEANVQKGGINEIKGNSTTTVKAAITELTDADVFTQEHLNSISEALGRVKFNSAEKGEVALNTADGWAMFCYAVQPIVPMEKEKADRINKDPENPTKPASTAAEIAEKQDRVDALKVVEKYIVTGGEPIVINKSDVKTIRDALYTAFPTKLSKPEIEETAKRVLTITGKKYKFAFDSDKIDVSDIKVDENGNLTAETQALIDAIASLSDYENVTIAQVQEVFGDSITVTSQLGDNTPKSGTIEIYKKAAVTK